MWLADQAKDNLTLGGKVLGSTRVRQPIDELLGATHCSGAAAGNFGYGCTNYTTTRKAASGKLTPKEDNCSMPLTAPHDPSRRHDASVSSQT